MYTLTKGLHTWGGPGSRRINVEAALLEAIKESEPTIYLFLDLHHELGAGGRRPEPGVVRAVLDAAAAFKAGAVPHTLMIVAPGLTLPVDLEKVVTVVDLPLPDTEEIRQVLETIVAANRDAIQDELHGQDRERMLQAAQGLTLWEADNAFARAIVGDRVLSVDDIPLVLEEKRQTIRKSGLLEFIPQSGDLEDIGGLDNLKNWLLKRDGAWLPEAAEWSCLRRRACSSLACPVAARALLLPVFRVSGGCRCCVSTSGEFSRA